jgi:hypothetical protein
LTGNTFLLLGVFLRPRREGTSPPYARGRMI